MNKSEKLAELVPRIMNAFHDLGRHHPVGEKLSMRQFQTLIILKASGSITLSQLCDKLNLAPSTGTELVNRVIELGFLQKGHEHADQRQVLLSVSAKGTELLEQRKEALSGMFSELMARFSVEDQKSFLDCFERIWELLRRYEKETA